MFKGMSETLDALADSRPYIQRVREKLDPTVQEYLAYETNASNQFLTEEARYKFIDKMQALRANREVWKPDMEAELVVFQQMRYITRFRSTL